MKWIYVAREFLDVKISQVWSAENRSHPVVSYSKAASPSSSTDHTLVHNLGLRVKHKSMSNPGLEKAKSFLVHQQG